MYCGFNPAGMVNILFGCAGDEYVDNTLMLVLNMPFDDLLE